MVLPLGSSAKTINTPNAPSVVVPAPTSTTVQAVAAVSPAAMAAARAADLRDQQKAQAIAGEIEVGSGFASGGAQGGAAANNPFLASLSGAGAGASPGFPAPRMQEQDDQNKQGRKEAFLREAEAKSGQYYLKEAKQAPVSKYEIKMGWKIPAFLIDGINSDLPGQVCAQVRENVYDTATGKYLLVPQGAKVCGSYDSQIAVGQNRILMVWNRIIFSDGSSLALDGMPGADQAGYAGFDAEVDNHYFKVFSAAAMLSIISAGVQLSQPQQASTNGVPNTNQTVAAALGQQLGQVSTSMIQRDLKIQPTLTQMPGYRFNIQITRDIVFKGPYKA
ncbi:TrbI/VirB10 family protein [Undibacterium arcticum]